MGEGKFHARTAILAAPAVVDEQEAHFACAGAALPHDATTSEEHHGQDGESNSNM